MASTPPRSGGGVKERSPCSPRIPDSPPPRRAEGGRKGHLQRIGTLPSLPPPTAHTLPRGREGTPAAVSCTFHFPVDRNRARATPTSFPRQNPATDTGTSSGEKAVEPRVFQTRSPRTPGEEGSKRHRKKPEGKQWPLARFSDPK